MSDLSFPTSNTLTAPVAYRCSEQLSVGFKMLHHVAQSFLLVVSTASLQTSSVTSHWDYHPNRSALSHLCAFEMLFSFPLPCLLTYLGCLFVPWFWFVASLFWKTKDNDPGVPRSFPITYESRCKDMDRKLIYWWVHQASSNAIKRATITFFIKTDLIQVLLKFHTDIWNKRNIWQ